MTPDESARRPRAPSIVWFLVGLVVLAFGSCLVMSMVAWQEATLVRNLSAEMHTLRGERQQIEGQFVAVQATATIVEARLATLEANDPARQIAQLQAHLDAASNEEELAALKTTMVDVQATVNAFQSSLDDLAAKTESLEAQNRAMELPAEIRLSVPRQRQTHNLSCESSAASMAAQYHGVDLTENQVVASLPRNDNPYLGFRGNVDGPTGGIEDYGVYAGPVMAVLNDWGLRATAVEQGVEGIQAALARGNPVIAWVPYDCLPSTPVETTIDGQVVSLVPNQHVVVITGFNADGVWANDPWDGLEDFYRYAQLDRGMSYFDYMAIEVSTR